jgi:integrase
MPEGTLGAWSEHFLKIKKRKRSIAKMTRAVKRLLRYFGAEMPLEKVTSSWIDAYVAERLGEDPRPTHGTVNRELAVLKTILRLAYYDDVIRRVPRIEMLPELNVREKILTQEQFDEIEKRVPKRSRLVLRLLWETGIRVGEALGLAWDNVDLEEGTARVVETKNGRPKTIPIPSDVLLELLALRSGASKRKPIFSVQYQTLRRDLRAAAREVGLEDVWIHDLRRSFITKKLSEGWDRALVAKVTGHRTPAVLERYFQPSMETLRKVVG